MPSPKDKTEHKQQKQKLVFSKKWDDYFLEFLILFFAVSLGFFVENYRVNLTNRAKEKDYMVSMIQDAYTDKQNIKTAIKKNELRERYLDSLSHLLLSGELNAHTIQKIYRFYPAVLSHPSVIFPTEITMQQLKTAGGMRLIKNKEAIAAIIRYDQAGKKLLNQQMFYETYQMNAINIGTKVINLENVILTLKDKKSITSEDLSLLTDDKNLIAEFGNMVFMFKGVVNFYKILLQRMDKEADSLIHVLKREYHLENELKENQIPKITKKKMKNSN